MRNTLKREREDEPVDREALVLDHQARLAAESDKWRQEIRDKPVHRQLLKDLRLLRRKPVPPLNVVWFLTLHQRGYPVLEASLLADLTRQQGRDILSKRCHSRITKELQK